MTTAFQFTVEGHIESAEGLLYLVCSDDTRLRVVPNLQEYSNQTMLWQVIPATDSNGLISSVKVVDSQPLTAIDHMRHAAIQVMLAECALRM